MGLTAVINVVTLVSLNDTGRQSVQWAAPPGCALL